MNLTTHLGVSVHAGRVEPLQADGFYHTMEATGQGFDAGSCRGKDAAEQIDDDACAIAGAAVRLEDRWKPAGLDRGGGQRPLSFEGPLQLSPLLRGNVRVHSVGDRDERNPVGDREQRQTEPVRGGRQLRGSRLVRQVGPEPDRQGCDPAVTSPSIEEMYRDDRTTHGLPAATPWDIGGPQPVVQKLVALGAIKGEVVDPGTGPGHHAIHYASKGLSATGIDASPTAIERAKQNAERAGVSVNFQVADATKLDGLEDRFDTVVDCAFYHVFFEEEELQKSYLQALHRATKPGARLYMFEFGTGNVNGFSMPASIPEENFRELLPAAGWNITYLGPTTYQGNVSVEAFEMLAARNPDFGDEMRPLLERLRIVEPWLVDGRLHMPFWEVHATRVD